MRRKLLTAAAAACVLLTALRVKLFGGCLMAACGLGLMALMAMYVALSRWFFPEGP